MGVQVVVISIMVAISLSPSTILAAVAEKETASDMSSPEHLEVRRGDTQHGFTYDSSGQLFYNSKPFKPAIIAPEYITAFDISLLPRRALAAAIGDDLDGQNILYLLKLGTGVAVPFQNGKVKWVAARKVFWSPSGRYLLALCAYEEQRFLRADIKTGEIVVGPFLAPKDVTRQWTIHGEPRWDGSTDVLYFEVEEFCNPFQDACGPDAENSGKVLARHEVRLDAETLAFRVR